MTKAELQAIKKRAEAATPGPWIDTSTKDEVGPIRSCATYAAICIDPEIDDREDIPGLLAYVEKLEGLLYDLSVLDQGGVYQKGCEDGRRETAELLKKIQWSGHSGLFHMPGLEGGTYLTDRLCPVCHEQEPGPHKDSCRIWELIR